MEKTHCDRCGQPLHGCSIMSMFNTDVICMNCKMKEKSDPRYRKAVEADNEAIRNGNYNFKGIGGY